jgi:outer membrane murein-binding lipoprotein Lpp
VDAGTRMLDQEQLRRRMRAARALAGYKVMSDLAAAIPKESQLGERKLRALESGEDALRPPALREIAAACGLPYEFFTADLLTLFAGLADQQIQLLASRVNGYEAALATLSRRVDAIAEDVLRLGAMDLERSGEELTAEPDTATNGREGAQPAKKNPGASG